MVPHRAWGEPGPSQAAREKTRNMLQLTAELIERQTHGSAQELRLHAPELARQLSPGQAVLVRTGWGREPYLRRTFHPIAVDNETWS